MKTQSRIDRKPSVSVPTIWSVANTLSMLIPLIGLCFVMIQILSGSATVGRAGLLVGFLILSLMGTGLGYHRYFSHRSFKANRPLKYTLGILGSAGGLGPISWFSGIHRLHHRFAETEKDPHTPDFSKTKSLFDRIGVCLYSAVGFTYDYLIHGYHLAMPEKDVHGVSADFRASVRDLVEDADIRWVERNYLVWYFLFILVPGVVLYLMTGSSADFWQGIVWGGLARISCNQIIFGFINILGHTEGAQPYQSGDGSRNLYLFAIFSNGESLHNNHHAFPWTAKTTMAWWQIDLNYYFLLGFQKIGWATDVKVPTKAQREKRLPVKTAGRPSSKRRRLTGTRKKSVES